MTLPTSPAGHVTFPRGPTSRRGARVRDLVAWPARLPRAGARAALSGLDVDGEENMKRRWGREIVILVSVGLSGGEGESFFFCRRAQIAGRLGVPFLGAFYHIIIIIVFRSWLTRADSAFAAGTTT